MSDTDTPTPTENTDIDRILIIYAAEIYKKAAAKDSDFRDAADTAKAAISKKLRAERIDELTRFKLPEYDHTKCIDQRSCIGYQNAQSDFDNEKLIRLAALQAEETS